MASIDPQRRPNGKYLARWREYPGGPQRTKSFARKEDARQHLVKVQHDLMTGSYIAPNAARVTLGHYVETHLARQPWRASTGDRAATSLRHAVRSFGEDRPLGSIRKSDVQAFVTGLPLAPSTVRTVHTHLSQLFSAAVEDRLVVLNPAKGVNLPQLEAGEVVPPSAEEVDAIYEAAPPWFRTAVVLGAGLGLRQGEASGLTADRVDWLAGRSVRIDRQWASRQGVSGFAPPKSASSYRSIPAADWLLAELASAVESPGAFLVHEKPGQPVDHHRFARIWRQSVQRAGVEPLRYHALRHRYASVLISGGCSIVAVQRAMGHSSASITLNLYGHLLPADTDTIRAAVSAPAKSTEDSLRTEGSR